MGKNSILLSCFKSKRYASNIFRQSFGHRYRDFFKTVNPLWPRYVLLDIVRVSQMLGIPLDWPQPDPIVMDPETLEVSKAQPYIYRLVRLGIEAASAGKGVRTYLSPMSRLVKAASR